MVLYVASLIFVTTFFTYTFWSGKHNTGLNTRNKVKMTGHTTSKYLFVVLSHCRNVHLRLWIRKYWHKENLLKKNTVNPKVAQLFFVLRYDRNCVTCNIMNEIEENQDIQMMTDSNFTTWMQWIKSSYLYTDTQFYIIFQDTTFVNFYNVIYFLDKQGMTLLTIENK